MKKLKMLAAVAVVAIFAVSFIYVHKAKAQGQVGWSGEGGFAMAPVSRIYSTMSLLTNGAPAIGTNSPGVAPLGSLWLRYYYTNSWSNILFYTAWTNYAGTNFFYNQNTGIVVISTAITGVELRVSSATTSNTPAWIAPQTLTNGTAWLIPAQ
jgi:hypothetical protein